MTHFYLYMKTYAYSLSLIFFVSIEPKVCCLLFIHLFLSLHKPQQQASINKPKLHLRIASCLIRALSGQLIHYFCHNSLKSCRRKYQAYTLHSNLCVFFTIILKELRLILSVSYCQVLNSLLFFLFFWGGWVLYFTYFIY